MKKTNLLFAASALALSGLMLSACGSKKAEEAQKEENLQKEEQLVKAVETSTPGINGTRYNAAFFENEANKSETPSDSTYVQTSTGLKYVIVKEGEGKNPSATDVVTVHYVGTLTDGQQFDSSIDRGMPASFPLNRVIPGWTEGLQLMKEGGEAVFYIPSNIGYGETGAPGAIPPNANLIFWVQLIEIGN